MELIPITIEAILQSLKEKVAKNKTPMIVQARIAVTPEAELLLDAHLDQPLETIRF